MPASSFSIFQFSLIVFLLAGLFVFVSFRLFKYLMQFFRLPVKQTEIAGRYLPVAELVTWIIYLLWSIQYLYNRGQLITLIPLIIFIILILYLAWFALKDVTAGVIFKTGKTHQINDHISVASITGKIAAMGLRNIEIEDYSGRIVSVPYSKIVGNVMLRAYPSQSLLSHNFKMQLELSPDTDVFQATEKIRNAILILPWSSQKKEPKVNAEEETENLAIFNITIFSLDEVYFKKTEKYLEKELGGKVL